MKPQLFSPYEIRNVTLANRVVVSPMAQYSSDETGLANQWHVVHLGSLAVSGAGLLFSEAIAVEPAGRVSPNCTGLWSDEHAAALEPVMDFCRRHGGAKMGVQLAHAGRKASTTSPWQKSVTLPPGGPGWEPISCSPIPYPDRTPPRTLDREGLASVRQSFVEAAVRADRLGFDVFEIHNAHGYLLHSFLSPLSNVREDEYGGSLENRMRFPLEVFRAMRDALPAEKPLGVRISATDWIDGGWDIDQSVEFAKALKAEGCDFLTPSSGGLGREQQIPIGKGYQIPFAARIREEAGIPTIAVGLVTEPQQAEDIIAKSQADLVAVGRQMLYDPRWAWRAAETLGATAPYMPPQYLRCYPAGARA